MGTRTNVTTHPLYNTHPIYNTHHLQHTHTHLTTQVEAAEQLYTAGADAHARDLLEKTPLHIASDSGHAPFVDFLISGVCVRTSGSFAGTAL